MKTCPGLHWAVADTHLTIPTLGNVGMIHFLFPLNPSPSSQESLPPEAGGM